MVICPLIFSLLLVQDQFTVEVSPAVFQVSVEQAQPAVVVVKDEQAETVKAPEKPYYIVMFTASWCQPCQTWKNNGNPQKIRNAGYNFTPVDIDENPQWKSKVDRYPTFWIVDHATRNPQFKFIGSTPSETIIQKAQQLAAPKTEKPQSIYGLVGTSHESRETLIDHLMNGDVHRGRHTLSKLQGMTDNQLNELHDSDH